MALQSKFKTNSKLRNCAVADKDHIGENTLPVEDRKGEHVAFIHEALNTWAGKQSPPVKPVASGDVSAQFFGSDTARVVRLFKTRNKILNFKGEIDNIVGIKTVAALDLELPAHVDPDPNPTPTSNIADIVVRFQGARAEGPLTPDSVLLRRRIVIYQPMPGQPFGDKVLLHPFNGRALIRVGRQTATIGAQSQSVFASVVAELKAVLVALKREPGKVFIHGSSSGGRNAIDFSAHISRVGIRPFLVAAADAAFFQADTASRPEANVDRPVTIPRFTADAGTAPNRHNFFQTIGNHAKRSFTQGVLFTSGMAGEEIHGEIAGFQENDFTRLLPRPLQLGDDDAHSELIRIANPEAERLIADELLLRG
jgi:hypothetical protein